MGPVSIVLSLTKMIETGPIEPLPVYARADLMRGPDGGFLLMELELIEPSLYLRMDPEAPWRFAEAFHDYVTNMAGGK